jgi:DNA replication factor GINS
LESGSDGAGSVDRTRVERETVRITDDIGAILGVDEREYDLSRDDVVRLPAANAGPLVERDAAERLD